MNAKEAREILDRALRCRRASESREGEGSHWSAQSSSGETLSYTVKGIKPLEELEQDLAQAFVWLWSLKDYIKEVSRSDGGDAQWIENEVNSDAQVSLSADVANIIKHGRLNRSRSKKYPKLKRLVITLPDKSIKSLAFKGSEVEVDTQNLSNTTLKWPILDSSDSQIGDAVVLLDHCVKFWELKLAEVEGNV